jgi:hypothetical protein
MHRRDHTTCGDFEQVTFAEVGHSYILSMIDFFLALYSSGVI